MSVKLAHSINYCAILVVIFYFSHFSYIYYLEFFCKKDLYFSSHLLTLII